MNNEIEQTIVDTHWLAVAIMEYSLNLMSLISLGWLKHFSHIAATVARIMHLNRDG